MKKAVIEFMLEQLGGEERVMELYHAAQPPHELDDACNIVFRPQEFDPKELAPGVTTRHWRDFTASKPKEKTQ